MKPLVSNLKPVTSTISIGADHAGFDLKEQIKKSLNLNWIDEGCNSNERCDYPDFAAKVAKHVASGKSSLGVLVCGSGLGMAIAANKIPGVRAVTVESEKTAKLAREHNDANVLCLGARVVEPKLAISIIEAWLNAKFEGGRHADRVKKITELEK